MYIYIYIHIHIYTIILRDVSPLQDSAGTAPSGTPPPAAPTTTDWGNSVPQRANPTQTAYV